MSADPTILFVIGAAKSGTSWLYRYLRHHKDCHFRSIKELHFFDLKDDAAIASRLARFRARLAELEGEFVTAGDSSLVRIGEEIADITAWLDVFEQQGDRMDAYRDYLHGGLDGEKVVGDVTPAYALLDVSDLRAMAATAADVRFIYTMREPVDRLWSHVRMELSRRNPGGKIDFQQARRMLWRVYRDQEPEITARGDYRSTIDKLIASVDPRRVLLAFTEEMISESGIRKVCNFLDIDYVAPDVDKLVHLGPDVPIQPMQRDAARDWLATQYDYVEQLFGRLPNAWQREPAKV